MSHCLIVIYAVEVIIFPGGRFDVRRETALLAEMNLTTGNNLSGCWLQTMLTSCFLAAVKQKYTPLLYPILGINLTCMISVALEQICRCSVTPARFFLQPPRLPLV